MFLNHYYQNEFSIEGRMGVSLMLVALSTLGACIPYPHSVTRNPAIEGRVLSAETGMSVAGAKIELNIGSDESWHDETVSDSEGRFAFTEQRDYRLIALLADAPRCGTTLSISAPSYHTRNCMWINSHGCSSIPMKLPRLVLLPEHIVVPAAEAVGDSWHCIESATEKAN